MSNSKLWKEQLMKSHANIKLKRWLTGYLGSLLPGCMEDYIFQVMILYHSQGEDFFFFLFLFALYFYFPEPSVFR